MMEWSYTVVDGTHALVILGHRVKLTNSGTERINWSEYTRK